MGTALQGDLDWMRQDRPIQQRLGRIGRWLYNWAMNLARPAPTQEEPPRTDKPYPDYVTCPHCGELEVEVWSNQKQGRCHNCGQVFEYPLPTKDPLKPAADTPAEQPDESQPDKQ